MLIYYHELYKLQPVINAIKPLGLTDNSILNANASAFIELVANNLQATNAEAALVKNPTKLTDQLALISKAVKDSAPRNSSIDHHTRTGLTTVNKMLNWLRILLTSSEPVKTLGRSVETQGD